MIRTGMMWCGHSLLATRCGMLQYDMVRYGPVRHPLTPLQPRRSLRQECFSQILLCVLIVDVDSAHNTHNHLASPIGGDYVIVVGVH